MSILNKGSFDNIRLQRSAVHRKKSQGVKRNGGFRKIENRVTCQMPSFSNRLMGVTSSPVALRTKEEEHGLVE